MFRRSRSKSRQPGPTAIPDEPHGTIYHYPPPPPAPPPPAPKKKKHYAWTPLDPSSSHSSHNNRGSYDNNSGSRRGRSNSTPHVRFTSETLGRERERERSSSLHPRSGGIFSFADFFLRRPQDPPRRYQDYRPHEGHISALADPEAQRQGREHRRHHQHHHNHQHHQHRQHHHSHHSHRHGSRRRHSVAAPSPAPEYYREEGEGGWPGGGWPESIYYLGTSTSPPLFLSERESRFRRRRERGLHEFLHHQQQHHPHHQAPGAAQSCFEYVERKNLPPGRQLRRVHSFWRSEDGRYF